MSRAKRILFFNIFVVFVVGTAAAEEAVEEEIVDRVVAVVGAVGEFGRDVRIVTAYELEIEARLVLGERTHSVQEATQSQLPDRLLNAVLETIINHLLIESEATRLELVTLTDEEINAERQMIEGRLGGEGSLEQFQRLAGIPSDLIDDIVRRRALVDRFVQQNIRFSIRVSDADIEGAYERGEHPFGQRPLEEIREALETYIMARRQRNRLTRWLEEARSRSWVRLIPE